MSGSKDGLFEPIRLDLYIDYGKAHGSSDIENLFLKICLRFGSNKVLVADEHDSVSVCLSLLKSLWYRSRP